MLIIVHYQQLVSNTDEKRQMLPSQTMPDGPEQTQKNSIKKPPYQTLDQTRSLNTTRCTMTIFMGGRDGATFMIPSLLQTIHTFTHPLLSCFRRDSSMTPPKHLSLLPLSTIPAPHKNFYCTPDTP